MIIKSGQYTLSASKSLVQREIPQGWIEIKDITGVFINPGTKGIVITGIPNEDDETHNCDQMSCTSIEHTVYRGRLQS